MFPVLHSASPCELEAYLALAKVGRWIIREDFSFWWSAEMYALFDLPPGCTRQDIVAGYHPDDRNYITRNISRCFETGRPLITSYRIVRPGGEVRQVFSRALRRAVDGRHELVGVNIDVTEQIVGGNAEVEEARRYRFIAENARDLIVRYDPAGRITFASPACRPLLGYQPDDLVGRNVISLVDPVTHPGALEHLLARGRDGNGPGTVEVKVIRADGTRIWLECNPRRATNAFGALIEWVDVLRDVTDRKRAQATLMTAMEELAEEKAAVEHGATHDYLTGLANRALFARRLDEALARHAGGLVPFVVLAMDLDHFKAVNDTLGHAAGDALLVQVAARLLHSLPPDALVARLGGDEFAAILPGVARAAAAVPVARAVIAHTGARYLVEGQAALIGVSIGVASGDMGSAEAIMRGADKALYRAKSQGRNAVCVCDEAPRRRRDEAPRRRRLDAPAESLLSEAD